jgi:hypothetical protein
LPSTAGVLLARFLAPPRGIEGRHGHVAGDVAMHLGQLDAVGEGLEHGEDLRSADHGSRARPGQREGAVHVVRHLRAFRPPVAAARQHDVAASGEQAGQALEGLAAHDHRRAERQRLEALQVLGEVPGQRAVAPDHAIAGARDDQDDSLLGQFCSVRAELVEALPLVANQREGQPFDKLRASG